MKPKLFIIANWMQGKGLSGGDRILIELARRLAQTYQISFFVSREGHETLLRSRLGDVKAMEWSSDRFKRFGYSVDYFYRTLKGVGRSLRTKMKPSSIVYSSSDFLPDVLPAFFMKWRHPDIFWVAGFYLFAPHPFEKSSPYRGKRWLLGFFYWLTQRFSYGLIRTFADTVFVTSHPDQRKFVTDHRGPENVVVVRGGVDVGPSKAYLDSGEAIALEKRRFDACYIGRFHYQKGVLELIDIWKKACEYKPGVQLAMIGDGPLAQEIEKKIRDSGLEKTVHLLGFLDGEGKFDVFKNSKIVLHPAIYDSGGMAAAEAMAWGLPGISFDLEALKTYYAKGMLKTECFNRAAFAGNILRLLNERTLYKKLSSEAVHFIREEWDWDKRAQLVAGVFKGLMEK